MNSKVIISNILFLGSLVIMFLGIFFSIFSWKSLMLNNMNRAWLIHIKSIFYIWPFQPRCTSFIISVYNTTYSPTSFSVISIAIVKRRNDRSHTNRLSSYCIHLSSQPMTSPSDIPANRNLELSVHSWYWYVHRKEASQSGACLFFL